ncbi:right-handed parallel beta-helix repeat-containing protein [Ferruginibacter paludis]|uniref:PKD domain-containing protein n=1 Tax=Ferruginibacter paludis TaxID=1310417 RepID=UPI0025B4008D|nr:right-handed parallel beta-helix repeat-containing protein [Ferruginibacter paludis]MDN3654812.1 right-handed parallel beta-helix repeat-containing protein [Ferruginibacter paludis]
MKQISLLLFWLFSTLFSNAKNYYVSASGDDSNDGLTINTPWQSLAKVNQSSFAAGDVILFKRGDVFYGTLKVPANNMSFDAYGTGNKPVLTGFETLTSWTNMGNGIWKTNVSRGSNGLKIVTINDKMQRMGRYPNYNVTDGGYLSYEGTNSGTPSVTDNQLSTSPYNWKGADIVIRKYSYVFEVCPITDHTEGTLSFTLPKDFQNSPLTDGFTSAGYGYFIQNDIRTLDSFGEWYFNQSSKDLSVYFGNVDPSSLQIKAATIDTLFNCGEAGFGTSGTPHYSNITVKNLALEGANKIAFFSFNGQNITIQHCNLNNNGSGVVMWSVANSLCDNNTVSNTLDLAIAQLGEFSSPTKVTNNNIKNTGLMQGMGGNGADAYKGIWTSGDNTLIQNNRVDSTGYTGIYFNGSNVMVKNNYVTNYCAILDDGGGIYTWGDHTKANRIIEGNIVINGIGARQGRPENSAMTWGIYTDGASSYVSIINNTVSKADGGGYMMNTGQDILLRGNTFYDVPVAININRFPGIGSQPLCRRNNFMANINYPEVSNFFYWNGQLNLPVVTDIQSDLKAIGTWDSSYYRSDLSAPFDWYYHLTFGGTFVDPAAENLAQWQNYVNGDAHSVVLSTAPHVFQYNATSNPVVYDFADRSKKDPQGNVYNNSATIPAWGSMLLFDNGAATGGNILPVANAGADKSIVLPVTTLTLSGNGTDADGTISNYTWTKISGPAGTTIVSANTASTVLNNLVRGTYNFELKVTDNKGAAARDTVKVVVNTATAVAVVANKAPVVNAGTDKAITLPANTVALAGTATDPDGAVSSYLWTKKSGPAGGTIATANAAATSISNLVQGTYNFELTVTDNKGAKSKDSLKVVVSTFVVNKAPVANAGADKTIVLPLNTVTLKGIGTDADGTIAGYTWAKISGPAVGTIATSNAASTTINSLVQGAYNFVLTVTDNKGAVSKDSVKVIVNAAAVTSPVANKAPVANAGADKTITLPANTVALGGSGTDTDGTISSYEWVKVTGPTGGLIGTTNAPSTAITSLVKGIYKYALIVKDNKGLTGRDTVQITVNAALHSLAASASAGTSKSVTLPGDTVSLFANVSVVNAIVTSYSWTQITGSVAIIENGNAAACLVKNLTKGNYTFELTVTDNAGGVAKDTISITVAEDPFLHRGSSLSVYPNPVKDIANLDLKTAAKDGTKIMVSVINGSGKVMSRKQFVSAGNNSILKLDMTDLLDGFYIVNLIIENDQPLNVKVIKAR